MFEELSRLDSKVTFFWVESHVEPSHDRNGLGEVAKVVFSPFTFDDDVVHIYFIVLPISLAIIWLANLW